MITVGTVAWHHPDTCAALHHWCLKGCWPFCGSIRAGSIRGPFPIKQQGASFMINPHLKQLILFVRKSYSQSVATVRRGYVLLDTHLPPACLSTSSILCCIQFPQQGMVKHNHFCPCYLEDELGGPTYFNGLSYFSVMTCCQQCKDGLAAHWVRVMLVGALPRTLLLVESKKAGKEEDGWTGLAALAHPVSV